MVLIMASSEGNISFKGSEEASSPSQGDAAYESGTLLKGAGSEKEADAVTIST